ncbi:MAG: acyltransferase [Colwellia sp.]|nr:acyltransferase [Colwellia sp.]
MKKTTYRGDIDGLRAIAVMSVIIFHAGLEQLAGGFIGVDIFYVISGYLITAIIMNALEKNTFSYKGFYARRAKRLLPAALIMILATTIFAAFILSPDKYYQLAKSAEFSNLFMANIWFMKHSGYFDISTQISPLVHMWSLSIEEQFYFFYPFILVLAYKVAKSKGVIITITVIFISSFSLNLLLVNNYPNFTFYMLPTRAWELGLGAIVCFLPSLPSSQTKLNSLFAAISVLLLTYALFFITEHDVYPGYLALIPTFSTALFIYSLRNNNGIIQRVLSQKQLVFIGKISYSSYLWHWPIIVFYRIYINERPFSNIEVFFCIFVSLLIGYLSWRFIENRYRYATFSDNKTLKLAGYNIAVSTLLIATILITKGFPGRVSSNLSAISNKAQMRHLNCSQYLKPFSEIDEKYCVIGSTWDTAKKKGIIWGDSHSTHWGQLLDYQAKLNDISLVIAPLKCPAYLDEQYVKSYYPKYPQFNKNCTFRNQTTLKWLKANDDVEIVIFAAAWSSQVRQLYNETYLDNTVNGELSARFPKIGAKLSQLAFIPLLEQLSNKKMLIIADIPRPNKNLNECAFAEKTHLLRTKCEDSDYKILHATTTLSWHKHSDSFIRELTKNHQNLNAIIPTDFLCDKHNCQTYINDELIYRDYNHIRTNLKEKTVKELAIKLTIPEAFKALLDN